MSDISDFNDDFEEQTGWEPGDYPNRDVVRLAYGMWLAGKARGEKSDEENDMHGHRWFIDGGGAA
ncbi:hypothetical protein DTA24_07750 [Klebsiella sp. P1CD1]|uniref:hypothetical protein n=1 Tax=Klebsiella sp. P1CD1 TaxID=2267618 RepID=UPI000F4FDD3A|nr:hypothetical protein [Klebsiella sp. P1CD1]AYW18549.1 hypothetical protein DTA24_07750 [Klebsiella sp. P1CD1]